MLELNKWFFVLLLNFLVLLYVLNIILFKPILKIFRDREHSTKGALDEAKDMDRRREAALMKMNQELNDARSRAKEIFEDVRKEGLSKQKGILEAANKQAYELIESARQDLRTETEKARQRIRSDVEKFSDDIIRKLIGT